ncbi:prolyl oligopeptidase family serine peptidase [Bifidobacterium sp. UMB1197]|nr:prolyl oligopeptidase family serine peptidase [Bifidobacterium sp. UMB1197]
MEDNSLKVGDFKTVEKPLPAKRVDYVRKFHNQVFVDEYAWMKNTKSKDLRDYINAQNEYTSKRVSSLEPLRKHLFSELKSRIQETDMSVPTRMDGYWYYVRTEEGKQYAVQCRMKIKSKDDWNPPVIDERAHAGQTPGEEVIFDANIEANRFNGGFFQLGGMDISLDGKRMLFGVDTSGNERFDFYIRDFCAPSGDDYNTRYNNSFVTLSDCIKGISSALLTPDGKWVFYVTLDSAWRPYQVFRHKVGTSVENDVKVFEDLDERFFVSVYESFDERSVIINSSSKTTSRVLMLPLSTPEADFKTVLKPVENVEYDVSFACFENAGQDGKDIPLMFVSHNLKNPNFQIDVIDLRKHSIDSMPFNIGEGCCVAQGSPYGCKNGDLIEKGASKKAISEPYYNSKNPKILQGLRGLSVDGLSVYKNYVALSFRANGLPQLAVMTKSNAVEDFKSGCPWRFRLVKEDGFVEDSCNSVVSCDSLDLSDSCAKVASFRFTSARKELSKITPEQAKNSRISLIGATGNPCYEAPKIRYSCSSYATLGALKELDIATGKSVLLKRGKILGDFNENDYAEKRVWVKVRDGESVPVSLVWKKDAVAKTNAMFITAYGAYEISSDPYFSVARLSMLDRGVLFAQVHVRGGGEMGRAWYENGRRRNKKHTFEDFIDVTCALQKAGYASANQTVANGGSAGGLLMGAVANMAPQCYAGIEADVPFVDALTSMLDESLPLTVTEWDEWGDPLHNAQDYAYLKSYTPYENVPQSVKAGEFPKILITSSINDTRVLVTEPLKWLARLQAAGVDAIARIETDGGHGGGSGRYKKWEEVCYENAWCLDAMGIS